MYIMNGSPGMIILLQILCCLVAVQVEATKNQSLTGAGAVSHTISYGDVHLDSDGLVLLYLGPDGTNISSMWGTLDANAWGAPYTICRQLGYHNGNPKSKPEKKIVNDSVPVWLTHVNCIRTQPNHILRCNYSRAVVPYSHDNDLYLDCFHTYMDATGDKAYSGQVVLYPLDIGYLNVSTSFGMVAIKYNRGGTHWWYIQFDQLLSTRSTDTLCRAMGYTNAVHNSAWTVGQYEKMGYRFKGVEFVTTGISSNNIDCVASCECIRCCLDEKNLKRSKTATSIKDALVIGCTFSHSSDEIASEGNMEICEFRSTPRNNDDVCPNGTIILDGRTVIVMEKSAFYPTVIVPSLFILLLMGTIVAVVLILNMAMKIRKERLRHGYIPLEGQNDRPHGGPNGSSGDGDGGSGRSNGGSNGGSNGSGRSNGSRSNGGRSNGGRDGRDGGGQ